MDRTASGGRFRAGDRIEVVTHFTGTWVGGFEVASTSAVGCSVRRVSDGAVLPVVFGYHDVRPAQPNPHLDHHRDRTPSILIHADQSDTGVVLSLPAVSDIASVEAIRDAVLAGPVARRQAVDP
jgi:hypothetical protein